MVCESNIKFEDAIRTWNCTSYFNRFTVLLYAQGKVSAIPWCPCIVYGDGGGEG